MLSVHSEKPLYLSPHLRSFPALSLKWFHCLIGGGLFLSFQWRLSQSYSFHPSLLQAVGGVAVLLFPPLSPLQVVGGVAVLLFPPLSPLQVVGGVAVLLFPPSLPSPGGWWCRSLTLSTPLPSPGGWWCRSLTLSTPLPSPGGWWCRSLTLSTPLSPLQVVGGVAVLLFPPLSPLQVVGGVAVLLFPPLSRWLVVSQSYSFHPSPLSRWLVVSQSYSFHPSPLSRWLVVSQSYSFHHSPLQVVGSVAVLLFPPLSPPGGWWCRSLTLSTPLSPLQVVGGVAVLLFPPLSPLSRWLMVSQSYSFHHSPLQVVGGVAVLLFPPLSSPGGWWCRSLTLSTPLSSPGGWWCRSLTLSSPLQVVDGVTVLLFSLFSRWLMVSQVVDGVTGGWWCHRWLVVWCPWLCACMLFIFQDTSHLRWLLCLLVYLLIHFPSLLVLHVQGSTSTVFRDGCQTLKHASLCFAFHRSPFVASSLNLWGWQRHADQSLIDWDCFVCFHHDLYGSLSGCLSPLYDVIQSDSTILFLCPLSVFPFLCCPCLTILVDWGRYFLTFSLCWMIPRKFCLILWAYHYGTHPVWF